VTPTPIEREELQRLVRDEHAQLVEVLPPDEYEDEHLPGAINIPLKTLDAQTTRQLDPQRPVIVYCYDYQCDVSPRAAWRLETLGFPRVYDYAAGKADWGSYGLPLDGHAGSSTRVSSVTSTDVPTCRLDELVPDVAARLPDGWDICVVTNDADIVLGLLGRSALRSNERILAEDAMTAGPSTIRPSARLEEVTGRMHDQNLTRLIVTRSDGTLFGAARAEDIQPRHTGG
jgi:rhodanese-related sulfurtransferase/CBS domain-containing protein